MTYVAAMLASFLPARHWSRFSSLPISAAAPAAGIVTLLAGGLFGVAAFVAYAETAMEQSGRLQMAIAEKQLTGELPEDAVTSAGPMAVAMLAPLAFLFLTPAGQFAGYLVASSFVRTLTWVVDRPVGDPVLTAIDAIAEKMRRRGAGIRQRRARERAEGAEVPDRRYAGSWAGLRDVEFVIVASRRKPEWVRGATIVCGEDCYKLGEAFDVRTADGLRTAYPLRRQPITEVVRHAIYYELPELRTR